jgi:hypothetical protein
MELNRPVVLVGQAGITTALDMGMVANAVHLTGRYSNLTMHGLRHENLAFGDKRSSERASGLSLINPFNYWIAFWQRCVHVWRPRLSKVLGVDGSHHVLRRAHLVGTCLLLLLLLHPAGRMPGWCWSTARRWQPTRRLSSISFTGGCACLCLSVV